MENNKNIDYIIDAVIKRGYDDNFSECNDFIELLQKRDFKDLITLELYERYFWNDRHEFILQLLKELVEMVSNFFQNPDTIREIQIGILQNMPSSIILGIVGYIIGKWGKSQKDHKKLNSTWLRIESNVKKIDIIFKNHDYILTNEIERIFKASREEILPLLKLCGCKCYIDKKRSIWIKCGLSKSVENDILNNHKFKIK